MNRYCGNIGYSETKETVPGVWEDQITERRYYGDVTRNTRRLENGEHLNDNVTVGNTLSIVADAYAYQNFHAIQYATWMGTKWKVTSVEVQAPRLLLTLGGVFNG